jgi:acyl-coenzyme A synthetase/AMP-(fatty) acid ligase
MAETPGWLETLPGGVLSLTPSHLRQLMAALPAGFQPHPPWRIICGGSLLPLALAREAQARITPDIRLLYGATEVGTIALGHAAGLADDPGQIGFTPSDAVVEIVDEAGRPVGPGRSGEIRARGPRLAAGYLGDPEATSERFAGGWFLTGDVGRRLADGRLVLEGRADDRMNLGGVKVMPGPLEAAALECEGVRDAAAFAVPDPAGFDHCWLAVVADPGFDRAGLAAHLARYPGLPAPRFAWTDEIPRGAMAKPDRRALRAAVLAATGG